MDIYCLSCDFMNSLYQQKVQFGLALYRWLAFVVNLFLGASVSIYATALIIDGVMNDALGDNLKKLRKLFIPLALVIPLLNVGVTDSQTTPIVHGWIFEPIEQFAGYTALGIVSLAADTNTISEGDETLKSVQDILNNTGAKDNFTVTVNGTTIVNFYAALTYAVERSMYHILKLGWALFGFSIGDTIIGLLMVLPYLFVVLIFAAFMVEAMFGFLSMQMFFPIALYCFCFPSWRPISIASFRIMLGAFLTIFFAAGAMGFSVAVVDELGSKYVINEQAKEKAEEIRDALERQATLVCAALDPKAGDYQQTLQACNQAKADATKAANELEELIKADKDNDAWIVLILMGGVSILLHLKSKTLASNLSGAQDGAGPAAATVGATKMLLLAGMAGAGKGAAGTGGVGNQVFGDGGSTADGLRQTAAQGGAVGLLRRGIAGLGNAMGGHGRLSPMELARGEAQGSAPPFPDFSGGGSSSGPVTVQFEQQQMQQLSEMMRGGSPFGDFDREGNKS